MVCWILGNAFSQWIWSGECQARSSMCTRCRARAKESVVYGLRACHVRQVGNTVAHWMWSALLDDSMLGNEVYGDL